MKREFGMFLSAAMLALCASACCCQKDAKYADYPNPALRKAIEEDIDAQLASYTEPYDEIAPLYSSENAKSIFLSIPELNELAENTGDFEYNYGNATKVSLKMVRKNGKFAASVSGLSNANAVKALNESLSLFVKTPFLSFSQVNLKEREIVSLDGTKTSQPVEFFCGREKCFPVVAVAKHGNVSFLLSVSTATKHLVRLDVIDADGKKILSLNKFREDSFPGNAVLYNKNETTVLNLK